MDVQNLKQRLSLKNLGESLLRVLQRFPIGIMLLVGLTVLLCVMVFKTELKDSHGVMYTLYFLTVGGLISISASLWGEEQKVRWKRWLSDGLSVAVWGGYCVGLYIADTKYGWKPTPAFFVGNGAWITAIVFSTLFGSFTREKNDLKSWHFLTELFLAGVISGTVSWVMTGGLEGLLYGTAALFDLEVDDKLALVVMILCSVLLCGMMFLALIPQGEKKHNQSKDMPSFLKKSVSWLLIPLFGCYMLVLYVYGITILVHWELPKGMISYLVSAVMGGYILCYVLLYPEITKRETWQSKVLTFWAPILILPLLVLMTIGVVRRYMDYGVTPPRLYLLTLLVWYYAVCIGMLAGKSKRFSWVALSFAALYLLSSGHPMNFYRWCRPKLMAKIEQVIAEKGLEVPLSMYNLHSNPKLTDAEADALYDDLNYMRSMYGKESIEGWVKEDVSAIEETEARIETSEIYYYNYTNEYISPQGYTKFKWVNNDVRLPEDSIYGGLLHVGYQGDVLLFDTTAIRKAHKEKTIMLVSSRSEKVAYAPTGITIKSYNNHTIDIQYSGYLFTKSK